MMSIRLNPVLIKTAYISAAVFLLLSLSACGKSGDQKMPESIRPAQANSAGQQTTASPPAAAVQLTERSALDKVLAYLYPDGSVKAEWAGQGDYAGYKIVEASGERFLDLDSKEDNMYLIHLYEIVVDDPSQNLSHTATINWFQVARDSGKITPMFDKTGNMTKEFSPDTSEDIQNQAPEGNSYHNGKYGFSVSLPEEWKEKYIVIEDNTAADMEAYVTFYHKSTYDVSPPDMRMGRLFSIVVFSADQWSAQKEDITSMCENYGTVEYGNEVFFFAGPTDVQFDPENKAAAEEYQAMSSDITGIIKTMAFEKQRR